MLKSLSFGLTSGLALLSPAANAEVLSLRCEMGPVITSSNEPDVDRLSNLHSEPLGTLYYEIDEENETISSISDGSKGSFCTKNWTCSMAFSENVFSAKSTNPEGNGAISLIIDRATGTAKFDLVDNDSDGKWNFTLSTTGECTSLDDLPRKF